MDMLVKLYDLADVSDLIQTLNAKGIFIRRAMVFERKAVTDWVAQSFGPLWADECRVAFGQHPIGCHLAVRASEICGFCCSGCTFLEFVGPIGIKAESRGQSIGRALLLAALKAMAEKGHAYAVIGDVGVPDFFAKSVGAVIIEGSSPGPYPARLKPI
jgi:ribosomal protein S18 acetylase RimI-like enzyme